jgi:hypothetical protein
MGQNGDIDDIDENVLYAEAYDYESGTGDAVGDNNGNEEEDVEDEDDNDGNEEEGVKDVHEEDGNFDKGVDDNNEDANDEGTFMTVKEAIAHFGVPRSVFCDYGRLALRSEANKRVHDK